MTTPKSPMSDRRIISNGTEYGLSLPFWLEHYESPAPRERRLAFFSRLLGELASRFRDVELQWRAAPTIAEQQVPFPEPQGHGVGAEFKPFDGERLRDFAGLLKRTGVELPDSFTVSAGRERWSYYGGGLGTYDLIVELRARTIGEPFQRGLGRLSALWRRLRADHGLETFACLPLGGWSSMKERLESALNAAAAPDELERASEEHASYLRSANHGFLEGNAIGLILFAFPDEARGGGVHAVDVASAEFRRFAETVVGDDASVAYPLPVAPGVGAVQLFAASGYDLELAVLPADARREVNGLYPVQCIWRFAGVHWAALNHMSHMLIEAQQRPSRPTDGKRALTERRRSLEAMIRGWKRLRTAAQPVSMGSFAYSLRLYENLWRAWRFDDLIRNGERAESDVRALVDDLKRMSDDLAGTAIRRFGSFVSAAALAGLVAQVIATVEPTVGPDRMDAAFWRRSVTISVALAAVTLVGSLAMRQSEGLAGLADRIARLPVWIFALGVVALFLLTLWLVRIT